MALPIRIGDLSRVREKPHGIALWVPGEHLDAPHLFAGRQVDTGTTRSIGGSRRTQFAFVVIAIRALIVLASLIRIRVRLRMTWRVAGVSLARV